MWRSCGSAWTVITLLTHPSLIPSRLSFILYDRMLFPGASRIYPCRVHILIYVSATVVLLVVSPRVSPRTLVSAGAVRRDLHLRDSRSSRRLTWGKKKERWGRELNLRRWEWRNVVVFSRSRTLLQKLCHFSVTHSHRELRKLKGNSLRITYDFKALNLRVLNIRNIETFNNTNFKEYNRLCVINIVWIVWT